MSPVVDTYVANIDTMPTGRCRRPGCWRHVGVALASGLRHVGVKGERHRVRVCMWDAGYSLHANLFKP